MRQMSKRRKIILVLFVGYALALVWGHVRLPLAAVKSLDDYRLLRNTPVLSASDDQLQMWAVQKRYLSHSINLVSGKGTPRISAEVKWNCGIVARVQSGIYFSPEGAEGIDGLYICVLGGWLRVYTFSHLMA